MFSYCQPFSMIEILSIHGLIQQIIRKLFQCSFQLLFEEEMTGTETYTMKLRYAALNFIMDTVLHIAVLGNYFIAFF
jgi:hypothetical protein